MGQSGTIWDYRGLSRTILDYMGLSGNIWDYLGQFGTIWDCMTVAQTHLKLAKIIIFPIYVLK